VFAVA
jgi:hypothetical protein